MLVFSGKVRNLHGNNTRHAKHIEIQNMIFIQTKILLKRYFN